MSEIDLTLFHVWLVLLLVWAGLYYARRPLVAWGAYFALRWKPDFRTPRARVWLWEATLNYADGKPVEPCPDEDDPSPEAPPQDGPLQDGPQ